MAMSVLRRWYAKAADFEVLSLFQRRRVAGPPRSIYVNQNLPPEFFDAKGRATRDHIYITNQVVTSKYTIITFLPKNLLEQFRRVANIFFLGIAILQFFSIFSTISPGVVILPLLVILAITAAKDGYEDIKRHQSDRTVNSTPIRVLSGGGWSNPNLMSGKSKTFVRALQQPLRRRKHGKVPASDIEMVERAAPPEVVHSRGVADAVEYEGVDEGASSHNSEQHDVSGKPYWKTTTWEDLRVGDFVKIMDNEPFPADILVCASSEEENVAFVETKNLDGETNLKSRNATPALTHLRTAADCADKNNACRIDCGKPEVDMYKLSATIDTANGKYPVDLQNVLLRGTVLRNTNWVIGIVLFTGEDTKIVLNSGGTPSKRGRVERQMNPQVFINLGILAVMAIACGIVDAILEQRDYPAGAPWLLDDNQSNSNPHIDGLITFAFALITFQNIIPISLYLSIEFVRTCQAAFIYFDKEMWYEKTDKATIARSWNLSDELGQIEYIFSDKTGTLTQNAMVFRQCSVGGKVYKGDAVTEAEVVDVEVEDKEKRDRLSDSSQATPSGSIHPDTTVPSSLDATAVKLSENVLTHFQDSLLTQDLADAASPDHANLEHARNLHGFFSTLALCHTVLAAVDPKTGAIEYKAQSPDEAALVQAAADVGYVFRGRERGEILQLQTPHSDQIERYELLNVLEFTSARKRMSVILKKLDEDDGRYFLLAKGADSVIFERLRTGGDELKRTTEQHLDDFAGEGLRTLTLAYKVISEEEYQDWNDRYHEATVAIEERQEKIDAVSDEIERDLRLLGATAIEDRLQDGVPEAIADLKRAGIKIWVATGDKLETAIAIGYSTNLIEKDSNLIVIRGGDPEMGPSAFEQMRKAVEDFFPETDILEGENEKSDRPTTPISERGSPYRLRRVSTGLSSIVGDGNGDRPGGFVLVIDGAALGYALAEKYTKDILLRLSMQCEGVICCRVSPLQKALIVKLIKEGTRAITLAIGDGANDVSMIQAADVGVGISGEEGLQAVNSSDYAIGQFRFLVRLLLVHGHWSYARNGTMIVNFFYKNFVCIGVLFWFQIYCAWSSQYVFDYSYLLLWNAIWTLAPVIGIGVFDRIVDDDILMALPELYRYGREGTWFGTKLFAIYMLDGLYQSVIIFFLTTHAYATVSARPDGWGLGLYEYSTVMAVAAVTTANLFNGLNTYVWTGWVWFAVLVGTILVWGYTAIYSTISPGWFVTTGYGNYQYLFPSAYFWFCIIITFLLSLLPRYTAKALQFLLNPSDLDIMRYVRKTDPLRDIRKDAAHLRSRMARRSSLRPRDIPADSYDNLDDDLRRTSFHSARRSMTQSRLGSRTDMSTGIVSSIHRGFDFSQEEHGVAMRRMQSNLSERRQNDRLAAPTERKTPSRRNGSHMFSLRRSLRRKKPVTPESEKSPR